MTKSIKNLARAIGLALALPAVQAAPAAADGPFADADDGTRFVSPTEAAAHAEHGALLLDARPAPAFFLAHPRGAVRIAWDDYTDEAAPGHLHPDRSLLARRLAELGVAADRPVRVIGAWDDAWGEEARIVWMLERLGVRDAALVAGGWNAWVDAGLPVARGLSDPEPRNFTPGDDPSVEATLDALADYDLVLDVRTRQEFDGATWHGVARGGHVPGAVHFEWTQVLSDQGELLTPEALRERIGLPTDARIAVYCTGGVRSAFVWAALREAGYHRAANYAGSWWEYAATDLPAE